ncbi:MAG: transglutaminase-like domain-containing protein [Conexivisphaerales archaeon]
MTTALLDYATPGLLTSLINVPSGALSRLADDPLEICRLVHALVIAPDEAKKLHFVKERFKENQIRSAESLVAALLRLNPAPLTVSRAPLERVIGTCRHFAVLGCALLRYRGIPSRVRCGFATYFQPGMGVDHWITEYREPANGRWIRVDTELLGQDGPSHSSDLRPEEFLSGGEAWVAFRRGKIDASRYGVYGSENWGLGEIRGNLVKDLAALNKFEMLPWDEWGRMTEAYRGETGPDYDVLLDRVAEACNMDDRHLIAELFANDDLRVPGSLVR